MNTILSILVALVLYAVVIYIVGRLNLGMTVDGFVGAFIAGAVIAVVAWLVNWLLVSVLQISIGAGWFSALVSLVVAADMAAQTVIDAVRAGAGELLEDVALFDVYTGPQIGEDRKSLTLALRFRAPDRTLTEDEASAARDAAATAAAERVGAVLRA